MSLMPKKARNSVSFECQSTIRGPGIGVNSSWNSSTCFPNVLAGRIRRCAPLLARLRKAEFHPGWRFGTNTYPYSSRPGSMLRGRGLSVLSASRPRGRPSMSGVFGHSHLVRNDRSDLGEVPVLQCYSESALDDEQVSSVDSVDSVPGRTVKVLEHPWEVSRRQGATYESTQSPTPRACLRIEVFRPLHVRRSMVLQEAVSTAPDGMRSARSLGLELAVQTSCCG
jgi:hypothetical protein